MRPVTILPFRELRTPRLRLRELWSGDAPALHAMRSDPRVMRHIGRPVSTSLEDAEALIDRIMKDLREEAGITWAVTLHGAEELIGTIGFYRLKKEHFRGEIGYLLAPSHWGQGFMGEALEAVVAHGFGTIGFHSIEAITDPRNTASNRLLARHGFVQEGLFKQNYFWNGEFQDSAVYARLAPMDRSAINASSPA